MTIRAPRFTQERGPPASDVLEILVHLDRFMVQASFGRSAVHVLLPEQWVTFHDVGRRLVLVSWFIVGIFLFIALGSKLSVLFNHTRKKHGRPQFTTCTSGPFVMSSVVAFSAVCRARRH